MDDNGRYGRVLALAEFFRPSEILDEDEGADALLAQLVRAEAALGRERADAPTLCDELLAWPAERRREALEADARFHTWGVCERLIQKALGHEEADPAEAGLLASLALAAAGRLDSGQHSGPMIEDLKARAWACLGQARRREGDLARAEEALREAAGCLAGGTGDLLVEARLLEFEADVRGGQGRAGEAASLLKQAASRYREIGETELLARVRLKRDHVLQQSNAVPGRPHTAFRPNV
jgi:hypothetical protein